jgi:GNAT superfamily N-acetyltransferase
MSDPVLPVRLLDPGDDLSKFHSGEQTLDEFLQWFAHSMHKAGGPRTYVAVDRGVIVGYYSLVASSIERTSAPVRLAAGMGRYPIPITLIARMAVDERRQGEGIGSGLLLHALVTSLRAADEVGSRAVEVHAISEAAKSFYEKFGFNPIDPVHNPRDLYLLMKEIRWIFRDRGLH